jgi:peptidoglycan-N-acetylglucosamine deacetylase
VTGVRNDSGLSHGMTLAGFHVVRPEPREELVCDGVEIVHRGAGERAEIALTFDDGPARWTEEIAAVFERHGCRATFFLRGGAVAERPEVVAALAAAGHELGNHLWSHPDASTLSRDEIREELERTADAIEAAGAPRPELARPPYFKGPEAVAEAAQGSGVRAIVLRSIGTSDWEAESAEQISEPVLANIEAGDIVCLHDGISGEKRSADTRAPTVSAVRHLVPALRKRGLKPVTVSDLLHR